MANISAIKLPNGTTYTLKDNGALQLTGGTVAGPVIFGDSVSIDDLIAGDLVVTGAASFTNNIQANTINGVTVGNSPKFTDTITTATTTGNGNAVTAISASNGALTVTKGSTFLTSYTETDPVFTASAAHGITSSDISNWNSKTSNTGTVTSVGIQSATNNTISVSGSPITTNGTITLGVKLSYTTSGNNRAVQADTSGNLYVAQKDDNTTYTFANGTNGFTVTPSGGSAQTVTVTPSITNNLTGTKTTATLTTTWTSNQQTVNVTGVTASNYVIVSPAPASYEAYCEAGIYCSAQASGTLTFKCDTAPTSSLTVNIMIVN